MSFVKNHSKIILTHGKITCLETPNDPCIFHTGIRQGKFWYRFTGRMGGVQVAVKKLREVPFQDIRNNTLKSDSSEVSKKVMKELKAYEKLQKCPNIIRFFGAISIDGYLGIVTEYISNMSLHHWLYIDEDFKEIESRKPKIILGIARGLEYMHRNEMTHNDIKSENIMLDHLWTPKIIDLGKSD
eukprot:NODE_151_length_17042_cov_0.275925.p7 type:complete len:185 gc:universal NODE_151_length_17042_cov_0.275925:15565-15011(-)